MYSVGFCYDGGETGSPGYRQSHVVDTIKDARKVIAEKLAGKKVTYMESGGKWRAHADDVSTGYIYFKVSKETWIALDKLTLGNKGEKAVIVKGDLSLVKTKARSFLEDSLSMSGTGNKIGRVTYTRTGDNIDVSYRYEADPVDRGSDIVLVRVA